MGVKGELLGYTTTLASLVDCNGEDNKNNENRG